MSRKNDKRRRVSRRKHRQSQKDRFHVEAGVAFLDHICKATDWIALREEGEDNVREILTDFMRTRPYLLDSEKECPTIPAEELVSRRSIIASMGKRSMKLCQAYGLKRDDVGEAYWRAMEEYRAVLDIVHSEGEGISISKLVDPSTGFALYDSHKMKRAPINYDPIAWILTGERSGVVSAHRMPNTVSNEGFTRGILTGSGEGIERYISSIESEEGE